jgi:phenylacetate-CoA ligase
MRKKLIPALNKSLLLPLADRLMNTNIVRYYREIEQMTSWKKDKIEKWRSLKLQNLIQHSYNNTIYYKDLFDSNKINPNEIKSIEDLSLVPPLTKDLAKENYKKLIPTNISSIKYIDKNTGGSSGDPFNYLLDKRSWSYVVAENWYNWERIGYKMGNKFIALGSSSILPSGNKSSLKHNIYYWLKGKKPINAMNMSKEESKKHLIYIKKNNYQYIYGYASSIFLLAKSALDNNIDGKFINGCITTSEILTDYYRMIIKEAFHCDIIDSYGAADGGVNAFKVNEGDFNVGYNCIVRVGEKVNSIDAGGILQVTDLYNYAMPLINYQLGDSAIISNDNNNNYNGQVISKVYGRASDVIELSNGNVLTGPGFTIFFKDMDVEAYSIKQIGALELEIEIKENPNYKSENDKLIIQTMKKYAGSECKIVLQKVDSFDVLKSGKRKYFISQ